MTAKQQIPVLMYHALVPGHLASSHRVHIPVELFKKEMEWLAGNGYRAISLNEMLSSFKHSHHHEKYCVITFDDGYRSLYTYALPLLKQLGFTATLYLTTGAVGKDNFDAWPGIPAGSLPVNDRPLTWNEMKEMADNGWDIQSHSVTHTDNSAITAGQLLYEVSESKKIIEQHLQKPVIHYAFPFGKYNTQSIDVLKKAGYHTSATVHAGLCSAKSDAYRLPRLEMNCADTLSSFEKKITTGFNSPKEKLRSAIRNIVFKNSKVKDLSKKITGGRIN